MSKQPEQIVVNLPAGMTVQQKAEAFNAIWQNAVPGGSVYFEGSSPDRVQLRADQLWRSAPRWTRHRGWQ